MKLSTAIREGMAKLPRSEWRAASLCHCPLGQALIVADGWTAQRLHWAESIEATKGQDKAYARIHELWPWLERWRGECPKKCGSTIVGTGLVWHLFDSHVIFGMDFEAFVHEIEDREPEEPCLGS